MDAARESLRTLLVRDVMSTDVVKTVARQRMSEVARLLVRHELSTLPVVDEHGVCVGMLSAVDFLKRDAALVNGGSAPHQSPPEWKPDDVAATHMTPAIQAIDEQSSVAEAARVMAAQHVHHLPVIDRHGRPRGIISTMDILKALGRSSAVAE
ncbi:MAG: hypothetical protein RLY70_452 [Planctomycetota bacterium]|jgi:CBS-domain-containing membrane protein